MKKIILSIFLCVSTTTIFSQTFDAESYAKEYAEHETIKYVEAEKFEFGYKIHVGYNPWLCSDGSKKGIVIEDYVNIRNAPDINAKKIGQVNRGFPIKIYSFSGSGNFKNGVYDYWAKISSDEEVYINAFYVTTLPFAFHMYKFVYEDGSEYYKDCLCIDGSGDRSYFVVNDEPKLYDLMTVENARLNFLINDLLEKAENREPDIKVQMTTDVGFTDECTDTYIPHIAFVSVKSQSVKLPYGIKIGTNIKEIQKILGPEETLNKQTNSYGYVGGSVINEMPSVVYIYFNLDENDNLKELFLAQYYLDE
ncbi:SH3 domain-containing protein [Treponema sp.]|uniref:SH3 domain-containing protein n=1 Tax=Treponema sp. TaxID=166 RepID=UPI00298E9DFD|nr:SH3 domain-containing protein [Treponema sp.]MCR5614249.1 SH3 domain-containing protein [Treponema sp.]